MRSFAVGAVLAAALFAASANGFKLEDSAAVLMKQLAGDLSDSGTGSASGSGSGDSANLAAVSLTMADAGNKSRGLINSTQAILEDFFASADQSNGLAHAIVPFVIEAQIRNCDVMLELTRRISGYLDFETQQLVTGISLKLRAVKNGLRAAGGGNHKNVNTLTQQLMDSQVELSNTLMNQTVSMIQEFYKTFGGTGALAAIVDDDTVINGAQDTKNSLLLIASCSADADRAANAIVENTQELMVEVSQVLAAAQKSTGLGLISPPALPSKDDDEDEESRQGTSTVFASIASNAILMQAISQKLIAGSLTTTAKLLRLSGEVIEQFDDATAAIVQNSNANLDVIIAGFLA